MRAPSSFHSTAAGRTVRERGVDVGARAGRASAGADGRPRRRSAASPGSPSVSAIVGDGAEVAAQHERAPHRGELARPAAFATASRHHALERALAQVAGQQPDEEPLLGLGRAAHERRRAGARRAATASPGPAHAPIRSNAASTSATVRSERGSAAGAGSVAQRRPADADLPLAQLAGQERDAGRDLGGRRAGAARAARWATFSRRADVAPTARDVSTSSARSTTQSWPNVLPLDRTSVCSVRCLGRQRCVHGPLAFPRSKLD